MVLTVYLDPCTINCRKVLAGLDLMGTKYDVKHIDYFKGEHKSDDYTKINPCQTVPAATDGDLVLTESNAILMYAADLDGGNKAYPKDLKTRAEANRWLLWEASVWFATNYVYAVENVVKPLLKSEPDKSILDNEAPKWNKAAGILDERLAKNKYLLGNDVSIADIAIASSMHLSPTQGLPLEKHQNLSRWWKDIQQLPEWQKTQPAVDKALVPNGHKQVRAEFNYTKDVSPQLTELYFYEDPNSLNVHSPGDDPHHMSVHNGWEHAESFDVDKNGFALRKFPSDFDRTSKWNDDEVVKNEFYPQVVEFLKKELGAKRVLVFDHTIRSKGNLNKALTQETNTSQRAPVRLVHCDYTAESGPVRVKQLLPEEADNLLQRRTAFINVWKPLNVVEEQPLAMCDVASAPPEDFFKLFLRYRDRTGENYVMRHSDKHHWWYFPGMTPEQTILLKTYDSDKDRAQFVGHTAFEDPTTKPDAVTRESCEIRTICFF